MSLISAERRDSKAKREGTYPLERLEKELQKLREPESWSLVRPENEREKARKEYKVGIRRMEKVREKLELEIADLAAENERLQSALDKQTKDIRAMQDLQAEVMDRKGFMNTEDDGRIRGALQSLASHWKSWAKKYAVQQIIPQSSAIDLLAKLDVPERSQITQAIIKAPSIMLNAALARFVTGWIFQQPFFPLPGSYNSNEPLLPGFIDEFNTFRSAYERAYRHGVAELQIYTCRPLLMMRLGDPSIAHAWRSLTLQLFSPADNDTNYQSRLSEEATQRRANYYRFLTSNFMSKHRALVNYGLPRCEIELQDIMRDAGELSSRLWKHRVWIECPSSSYYLKTFQSISDEVEIHPSQHFDEECDAEQASLVEMVVQPSILASNTEIDSEHARRKVWLKAIVLLGESEQK